MFENLFCLRGRSALVTGSSRGIGAAVAAILAENGADIAIHATEAHALAQTRASEMQQRGVRTALLTGDLANPETPRALVEQATAVLGKIDILVLNASVQIRNHWLEVTRDEFDRQFAVNVRSCFEMAQHAAPGMKSRRWGRILTLGSVQQMTPAPALPIYAATKSALMNLVRTMARDLAPHGITVNNLAPGLIETDRNRAVRDTPEKREALLRKVPVGFMGQPEDCAGAALVLCSEAGRYITGADWLLDGGWSMGAI